MGNQIDIIAQLVKQKMCKEPYDYVLYDGDSLYWIESKIDSVTSQLIYFYNSEKVEVPKEEIINYFKNSDDYKWGEYKNYFVIKLRDEARYIEILDIEDISKKETIYITYNADPTELCKKFVETGCFDVSMILEHCKSVNYIITDDNIRRIIKTLVNIEVIQEIDGIVDKYKVLDNSYELMLHFIEKYLTKNKETKYER